MTDTKQDKTAEMLAKGGTFGAALAGALVGAGAMYLSKEENRQRVRKLVDSTAKEFKKMTSKKGSDVETVIDRGEDLMDDVEETVLTGRGK